MLNLRISYCDGCLNQSCAQGKLNWPSDFQKVMRRSERRNTLQTCPQWHLNPGVWDLWSTAQPVKQCMRLNVLFVLRKLLLGVLPYIIFKWLPLVMTPYKVYIITSVHQPPTKYSLPLETISERELLVDLLKISYDFFLSYSPTDKVFWSLSSGPATLHPLPSYITPSWPIRKLYAMSSLPAPHKEVIIFQN